MKPSQSSAPQQTKPQKPLTTHWADIAAFKLVKQLVKQGVKRGDAQKRASKCITVASGISPSGTIHMGNFREVISAELVVRALKSLGEQVRYIHSWDDFDALRKVPQNIPGTEIAGTEDWQQYLGKALSAIPDPWKQAQTFALGRMQKFAKELASVGIEPEFVYQSHKYAAGVYGESIKCALDNASLIRDILNTHRKSPLEAHWLPIVCYCERCGSSRTDLSWDGRKVRAKCNDCSFASVHDVYTSKHIKLTWRVDWPMRWAYEGVDFEPGGKDHSSFGGSYDTAKEIVTKVFHGDAPEYLPYDFVRIKGGSGKMSSSSGEVITLTDLVAVYEPQMIRWLYASQRPNHEFALSFGEDVIKAYEEFDQAQLVALSPEPQGKLKNKYPLIKRTYELSCLGSLPEVYIKPPAFRAMCDHLQVCGLDSERTLMRFYPEYQQSQEKREVFQKRAQRAIHWLENYAPENFVYSINTRCVDVQVNATEKKALLLLKELAKETEFAGLPAEEIHSLIYECIVRPVSEASRVEGAAVGAGEVFRVIYHKLISKGKGPRLAGLLKEIGSEKVLSLLADV